MAGRPFGDPAIQPRRVCGANDASARGRKPACLPGNGAVSARIVHLALKVADLERATRFYEDVFRFRQTGTGHARGHVSRHMTDGAFDLALMVYDSEDEPEAQLSGPGPCIHHFGIEVTDRDAVAERIMTHGGKIISDPNEGALKFRAPNGVIAETTRPGRYRKANITGPRIRGLAIETPDPAATKIFYESVFGLSDDGEALTDGAFRLYVTPASGKHVRPSHHHWIVQTDDVAGLGHAIEQHGGVAEGPNLYRVPDGSLLEVTAG